MSIFSVAAAASTHADALVKLQTLIVDQGLTKRRHAKPLPPTSLTSRCRPDGRRALRGRWRRRKCFMRPVPNIHASVEQMIVAGDRVITHLRFTGHFTGTFNGVQGKGQPVDFIYRHGIYRVRDSKIAENWHLEDNLTLLQQLGVVAK